MRISVLTTITNPIERQDRWEQAIDNYLSFADEVVVVDGSDGKKDGSPVFMEPFIDRLKYVFIKWPEEWHWCELPKHLNAGLEQCTGDWVMKLDIDQFIHEDDFKEVRSRFIRAKADEEILMFQKKTPTFGRHYYYKGDVPIAFRRSPEVVIGKQINKKTDLCFPVRKTNQIERVVLTDGSIYDLPIGEPLRPGRTGIDYWNYDYFFKTKKFTKKEFYRFSRAYYRYFKEWCFGSTEDEAFEVFLNLQASRHKSENRRWELPQHPQAIREEVKNLTPEQFGYYAWHLIK